MTRKRQATQRRRAGTTGSPRHGGRPTRRDPDRWDRYLCPSTGLLLWCIHADRRDRTSRVFKWILDDYTDPVGVRTGHHRQQPVPFTSRGVEHANGVMKGRVVNRKSGAQVQYGLEQVQSPDIIPGEIVRLQLLDPAAQGVGERPEAAVKGFLVRAVVRHHQVLGHPDDPCDRVRGPTGPVDLAPCVIRHNLATGGKPDGGLHLVRSSGCRG